MAISKEHNPNQFRRGTLSAREYREKMLARAKERGLSITKTPLAEFEKAIERGGR